MNLSYEIEKSKDFALPQDATQHKAKPGVNSMLFHPLLTGE